ncbi:LCI21 [Auxenochlorella protothecoides x Auxenochlorella symbiontica]
MRSGCLTRVRVVLPTPPNTRREDFELVDRFWLPIAASMRTVGDVLDQVCMQAMPAGVRPQVLAKVAGFYVLEDSPVGTLDRDDVLQIVIRKHVMHDRRGAKRPQREDLPTSAAHLALPAPGDAGPPLRSATAGGKVSHQDQLRKIKRVRLGEEDVSSSSSSSSEGTEESSSTSDEEPDDGSSGSSSSSSEGEAVEGSSSSSSEEETDTSSSEEESGEARAGRCASLSNIGLRNGQSPPQLVGLSPASPAMLQEAPTSGAKGPSRSARRKAAKRRLKRMGILAGPGSANGKGTADGLIKRPSPAAATPGRPAECLKFPQLDSAAQGTPLPGAPRPQGGGLGRQGASPTQAEILTPVPPGELPGEGDVLQYRLLECWGGSPEVSSPRRGLVCAVDPSSRTLVLKPHPPTAGHPLQQRWEEVQRLREAAGMDDDDEKDEPEYGAYAENGALEAAMDQLVEPTWVGSAPRTTTPGPTSAMREGQHAAAARVSGTGQRPEDAGAFESQGPAYHSRLGPPPLITGGGAAASPLLGSAIVPEGAWADLYAQLQARRAVLSPAGATASGGVGARSGSPVAEARIPAPQPASTAPAPMSARGAVKPRPGVRRSALGPMLNALRRDNAL